MDYRSPATDHQSPLSYYTLADLVAQWERGEITLGEVVAHWPHDGKTNDELLRELLEILLKQRQDILELRRRS